MKTRGSRPWLRWLLTPLVFLGFAAGVVVLLLWLAGKFTAKVPMTAQAAEAPTTMPAGRLATASLITVPMSESAVGTIRAVHETTIASRILARVLEVKLKAGQAVKAGQTLVKLDDADLRARLEQNKAALAAAQAAHAQAVIDEARLRDVVKTGAASRAEYDKATLALKSTAAEVDRARQAINETQAMVDYATLKSPMDGIIIDKKVDVGDTVMPGQVLVTLYDPTQMQLVASVRESLTHQLKVGQDIGVQIDLLKKLCSGTISEIVPEAQSASRSFQVKVTGPCPEGIYSGMFGRIIIPLGDEQVLVIPAAAVRDIGQLELVDVLANGRIELRAIRTGRRFDGNVEVLSGLREGEQVILPQTTSATAERGRGTGERGTGVSPVSDSLRGTAVSAVAGTDHGRDAHATTGEGHGRDAHATDYATAHATMTSSAEASHG